MHSSPTLEQKMKKIILTICCASLIQISTCGNKKSISSSYSRDGKTSIIEKLFVDYIDEHENIEDLFTEYQKLQNTKSDASNAWTDYDRFAKQYWSEARYYVNRFDTASKELWINYLTQEEKKYEKNVTKFNTAEDTKNDQMRLMNNTIHMMKLLVSHHQFNQYLTNTKPDLNDQNAFIDKLKKLNQKVETLNESLTDNPEMVKSQK